MRTIQDCSKRTPRGNRGTPSLRRYLSALAAFLMLVTAESLRASSVVFTNTPGFVMGAVGFDRAGDLYYIESDGVNYTASSRLVKRTATSGYSDPVTLFDYGDTSFGAFVTVRNDRVYFGESSSGTVRSVDLDGANPSLHATVAFPYELAFASSGEALISLNPNGFGQTAEVALLDLNSGTTSTIVTNTNDFTGPIAFDTGGNLYYGASGSPFAMSPPKDIYLFTPAQIVSATSGPPLDLADGTIFAQTPGNAYFAMVPDDGLYRHAFGGLTLIDLDTGAATPAPGEPGPSFGPIVHNGSSLFGVTTDFSTGTSDFVLIPEPATPFLVLIGVLFLGGRTRRRPRRQGLGPRPLSGFLLPALCCGANLLPAPGASLLAGEFPPAAGQSGSTAVPHDDSRIVFWATAHTRFQQGSNASAFDDPDEALGPAASGDDFDVDVLRIVSLGRGGEITLTFPAPIPNGPGDDFAVFENGFSDGFLELAFVEVSDDGVNFVRFPAISDTPAPVPSFGAVDPTNVDGLAGKYRLSYGTPFDLSDVGMDYATHVRIIDVVGNGGILDSENKAIYDPYPTITSAGFDLDAVAVFGTDLDAWRAAMFSAPELADLNISGPNADPDHDGLINLFEYDSGSDPKTPTPRTPLSGMSHSDTHLQISFYRSSAAFETTIHVEVSENLSSWTEIARAAGISPTVPVGMPGASSIVETPDGGRTLVVVSDSVPLDGMTQRYARLRVSKP